jgi:hypothetical protein
VRDLYVVALDEDGAWLLASDRDGAPSHRLADPSPPRRRLRRRRARPEATPAQIQARLRGGASPESVARATGTDLSRVQRWAAPVQAELGGALARALASVPTDGDVAARAPLRELVTAAVTDAGDEVDWQVSRRADGRWRIKLRLTRDGRARTASWIWDDRRRRLVAASARARRMSFED